MAESILGKDIYLKNADLQFSNNQDFSVITFKNNLQQAIIHRLNTIKGEYVNNNEYGSELTKCFGQPKNDLLKTRITGYIVECLNQEPRIDSIEDISISFDEIEQYKIDVRVVVIPIDSTEAMNLVFPFFIQ